MKNHRPRLAAVIGCGKFNPGKEGWAIGHAHADGYKKADPGIRLRGVDPNPENLAAFGQQLGVPPGIFFLNRRSRRESARHPPPVCRARVGD